MLKSSGRPPRSAQDVSAARQKIADVALKLFQNEGYGAVSIRRLAKDAGCAPMTIYAHFDGKIDILRYLWADVLDGLFAQIRQQAAAIDAPREKLEVAVLVFVGYWIKHPEHFRLVFMSGDITRPDVSAFVKDAATLAHFAYFTDLVQATRPDQTDTKSKVDILVSSMIGIALCANTIADYPWEAPNDMAKGLLATIIDSDA